MPRVSWEADYRRCEVHASWELQEFRKPDEPLHQQRILHFFDFWSMYYIVDTMYQMKRIRFMQITENNVRTIFEQRDSSTVVSFWKSLSSRYYLVDNIYTLHFPWPRWSGNEYFWLPSEHLAICCVSHLTLEQLQTASVSPKTVKMHSKTNSFHPDIRFTFKLKVLIGQSILSSDRSVNSQENNLCVFLFFLVFNLRFCAQTSNNY